MGSIFSKILLATRKHVFIPLYVCLAISRCYLRRFFLGPDNSILFISKVSKDAVIPLLKISKASIGENCDIESGLVFHNCSDLSNLLIGNNCHIGKNTFFDLREKVIIKDNCTISMNCCFITHIDPGKSILKNTFPQEKKQITLHDNVYVGANVTILMGVVLQQCSFVAANSLVNKDVRTRTIVAGVPAKKIGTIPDYQGEKES